MKMWKNPFEEHPFGAVEKLHTPYLFPSAWKASKEFQLVETCDVPWIFNRAMVWLDEDDGLKKSILCYSDKGILHLSGSNQVSRWFTNTPNYIDDTSLYQSSFIKKNTEKSVDFAALPGFEFQIDQHPNAELEIYSTTGSWFFAVHILGRSGPAIFSTGWKNKPEKMNIDLRKEFRKIGFWNNYAKLNFILFLRAKSRKHDGKISFSLRLIGKSAIIPCLPIIRTVDKISKEGVTFYAVVVDGNANRLKRDMLSMVAYLCNQKVKLSEVDNSGIWQGRFLKLPEGEHMVRLEAKWNSSGKKIISFLNISIKKAEFIKYDPRKHSFLIGESALGSLSGSFVDRILYPVLKKETTNNLQIHGPNDYLKYQKLGKKIQYHMWSGLTESEMNRYFAFLEHCGWKVVRKFEAINDHRLFVNGRISPHGVEHFALTLRIAEKHQIFILMDLTHSFPYGFFESDWYLKLFKEYLICFFMLFSESPQLIGMTPHGEPDVHHVNAADGGDNYLKDIHVFIRKLDKNHLIFLEHPGSPEWYWYKKYRSLDPREHMRYPLAEVSGYRTYGLGKSNRYDSLLTVYLKMMQCSNRAYIGECCWPGQIGDERSGAQTEDYRLRVRDNIYLGLIHQMPLILSWGEWLTEDEAFILSIIRSQVDWDSFIKMQPKLAIRLKIPDRNVDEDTRFAILHKYLYKLVEFNEVFSKIPLEYCYIWEDEQLPFGVLKEIIPTKHSSKDIKFFSEGGIIPEEVKGYIPLNISGKYTTNYLWSTDRRILLVYIRNTAYQELGCSEGASGAPELNRRREISKLEIAIQNLPSGSYFYKLYDLDIKKLVKDEKFNDNKQIRFDSTSHDYFLLVKYMK